MGLNQTNMSRTQPFTWYGSKYNWLNFIIPKLPNTKRYVEPYGGSATVLLNKEKSEVEAFNDIDGEVINFFKVLRDRRDELVKSLKLTPYHEGLFDELQDEKPDDELRRAIRFFVLAVQSYNASQNSWSYTTSNPRRGKSMNTSRYEYKIQTLDEVADRLTDVQFFCRDALDVIGKFDYDDCLIYLDPPYPHSVRGSTNYNFEMSDEQHREMAETVKDVDAYVAISSYRNDIYDESFVDWNRYDSETRQTASSNKDNERVESLYTNYDVDSVI